MYSKKLIGWACLLAALAMASAPGWAVAQTREQAEPAAKFAIEVDVESVAGEAPVAEADVDESSSANKVGWLRLGEPLTDAPPPVLGVSGQSAQSAFRGVLDQIRHVAADDSYRGMVIFLDGAPLSFAQVYEMSAAIHAVRESGKKVLVFAEAYGLPGYMLACAADEIALQHKGFVYLTGIGVEEMYFAGLLEKIGMKADLLQVGKYKGAADPMVYREPSKEWSQNFGKLLDDLYVQTIEHIAKGRGLSKFETEKAIEDCLTMRDTDYVKRGLIDTLAHRDLTGVTGKLFGKGFRWDKQMGAKSHQMKMDNPFAIFGQIFEPPKPKVTRPSLALISMHGPIYPGDSQTEGMFSGPTIGSRTIVKALAEARDNDLIRGVVLRIDSPGGSALASDVIWQAIRETREKKPVYVSISSMAASGGYYIACAADEIYVTPTSIVGSIGVVGGKLVMGDLYEMIGVNVTRRVRGPNADLFNSVEPFTDEQRQKVHKMLSNIYDNFRQRVQAGRGKRLRNFDAVAQGRLFTGRVAVKNGLVDEVGGVEQTIEDLAGKVGLPDGEYDVLNLPHPKSLGEYLEAMLGVQARGDVPQLSAEQLALVQAVRRAIGEQAWRNARNALNGMMLLRDEPGLTLLPAAVYVTGGQR